MGRKVGKTKVVSTISALRHHIAGHQSEKSIHILLRDQTAAEREKKAIILVDFE